MGRFGPKDANFNAGTASFQDLLYRMVTIVNNNVLYVPKFPKV